MRKTLQNLWLVAVAIHRAIAPRSPRKSLPVVTGAIAPALPVIASFQIPDTTTREAIPLQPLLETPPDLAAQPIDRAALVTTLLDEAWAQGITTYPTLIAYVKEKTGAGCSRRAIAHWKKQRDFPKAV